MNAPFNLLSDLVDMNGISLMVGNRVRKYDYMMLGHKKCKEFVEGTVVFKNGAYRICIYKDYRGKCVPPEQRRQGLTQNFTLLYDQILGTQNIEVIT